MKLKHFLPIFFIGTLFVCSCTSYKNVPYFQDLKRDSIITEKINNYTPLTIQPGDLLAVHVTSLSQQADQIFNYNLDRPSGLNTATNDVINGISAENTVYGHLVDENGEITMPEIGKVKVAGLTTSQIAADLENKLSTYLSSPIVDIRLENFRVSVLGDVKNPGSYNITDEKTTVSEVLALAGDLNTTGIRTMLLIREVNGERKYITLDLRSKSVLSSPYYYMRNNDILYIQPNHDKVSSTDSAFEKVSLIIAALSLVAIYLTRK